MSTPIRRFSQRLALAACLAGSLVTGAWAAQGVLLTTTFTDFTQWSLYGNAVANNTTPGNGFTYSDLMLTGPGSSDQAGAGFAPAALNLDFNQAFNFDFHFFIPPSQNLRGDGLTFTLARTPGVGQGGSGLGYEGLGSESVAFAIDTFHFNGEPVSPSLQVLAGGNTTPLAFTETGLGDSIRDPNFQWSAMVSYQPSGLNDNTGTLTGRIEHLNLGSFSVSASVDFNGLAGSPVYYGFTGANGLATDGHFITSAAPIPEPGSAAMLLAGGLLLAAWSRRSMRTRGASL